LFSSSRESFSALRFRTSAIWSRWRSSSSASCSEDFPIDVFWRQMLDLVFLFVIIRVIIKTVISFKCTCKQFMVPVTKWFSQT
jgi:hypothetical protein